MTRRLVAFVLAPLLAGLLVPLWSVAIHSHRWPSDWWLQVLVIAVATDIASLIGRPAYLMLSMTRLPPARIAVGLGFLLGMLAILALQIFADVILGSDSLQDSLSRIADLSRLIKFWFYLLGVGVIGALVGFIIWRALRSPAPAPGKWGEIVQTIAAHFVRMVVGMVGMAIAMGQMAAAVEILIPTSPLHFALWIALYLVALWLAILIHELGHATAARVIGWRVHAIAVWPVLYRPKLRKLKVTGNIAGGDLAGLVMATPPLEGNWDRGKAIFYSGGIQANLSTAAIGFAAVGSTLFGPSFDLIMSSFAVSSCALAAVNLVPVWGRGGRRSDGALLVDALRGRKEPQMNRLAWLLAMQVEEVPIKDWDPSLIRMIEADMAEGTAPDAAEDALSAYYLAVGDLGRARAVLDRIAAQRTDIPHWVWVHQAFLVALMDKNGAEAQRLLDLVPLEAHGNFFYLRSLAVIRHVMGDGEAAVAATRQARILAEKNALHLDSDDTALLNAIERNEEWPAIGRPLPATL